MRALTKLSEVFKPEEEIRVVEEETLQIVGFIIGEEEFGVDIHFIKEIIEPPSITRVPKAPHFVKGVINLRGHVIPVVDLRKRFGLTGTPKKVENEEKIVVVEVEDKTVGFFVDAVTEVIRFPKSRIEPPPPMIAGIEAEYITGIGKRDSNRIVIILNVQKILEE